MLKRIVFPEGDDERVQLAAKILIEEQVCHPVFIGPEKEISEGLDDSSTYSVIKPDDSENVVWQGAGLVRSGDADGIVSGAVFSTPDVLRAYIKVIGTAEGVSRATSCFLMEKGITRYIFADCGMNIAPTSEMLAESAYLCSEFALLVDIDPKVAFLSFSTKGSAKHEAVDKVTDALKIFNEKWPDLLADGELQLDAAIIPAVTDLKAPDSPLKGQATILIFPDLNSGNIAYKLVERLGGFKATGPLLLGLEKPAYDLSRGCSAEDIVRAARTACLQSAKKV